MSTLRVKNWSKYQHYKDRCPPWIKLMAGTFQDYEFSMLHDASKLLAICIWTLASRTKDGSVPGDLEWIKRMGGLGPMIKSDHLKELINRGFLVADSAVLADCQQDADPEERRERDRGEDTLVLASLGEPVVSDFDRFWEAYPRKTKKANALKAWKAKKPEINSVLSALGWQRKSFEWNKDGGQFIPHPASYLNAEQWLDEPSGGKRAPTRPSGPPVAIAEAMGQRAQELAAQSELERLAAAEKFKRERQRDAKETA